MSLVRIIGCALQVETAAFKLQQPVRWRKPRWIPVARGKLFKVSPRPHQDEDEKIELHKLYGSYRTKTRAVRRFFYEQAHFERLSKGHIGSEENLLSEQREWEEALKENEIWNKQIAEKREIKRRAIDAERKEQAEMYKEKMRLIKEKKIKQLEEDIQKQVELSKTFITKENLDDAIRHIMDNPVDYNFAIDLNGNIHKESDEKLDENKQTAAI